MWRLQGNHVPPFSLFDRFHGRTPETRPQQTVVAGRHPTTLQVAQDEQRREQAKSVLAEIERQQEVEQRWAKLSELKFD